MTLAEKLNPKAHGFSPMMTALVGALIGHDFSARDPRGGKLGHLSITSDGFLIADTTSHETGAFIGTAADFERNLAAILKDADLTEEEQAQFSVLKARNLTDWRTR